MEDKGIVSRFNARPPKFRHTPDHPPYAEMIRIALDALAVTGKKGYTVASISRCIVATHLDLPWGHSNFLRHYLRKLVDTGEISLTSSHRYCLPPPNPDKSVHGRKNNSRTFSHRRARPASTGATAPIIQNSLSSCTPSTPLSNASHGIFEPLAMSAAEHNDNGCGDGAAAAPRMEIPSSLRCTGPRSRRRGGSFGRGRERGRGRGRGRPPLSFRGLPSIPEQEQEPSPRDMLTKRGRGRPHKIKSSELNPFSASTVPGLLSAHESLPTTSDDRDCTSQPSSIDPVVEIVGTESGQASKQSTSDPPPKQRLILRIRIKPKADPAPADGDGSGLRSSSCGAPSADTPPAPKQTRVISVSMEPKLPRKSAKKKRLKIRVPDAEDGKSGLEITAVNSAIQVVEDMGSGLEVQKWILGLPAVQSKPDSILQATIANNVSEKVKRGSQIEESVRLLSAVENKPEDCLQHKEENNECSKKNRKPMRSRKLWFEDPSL